MKKQIPRMLKSASLVYAFDCFGTIFSSVPFFKFLRKSICSFNPSICNIRWIMLIPDTKWSSLKANVLCFITGVRPAQIIKYHKDTNFSSILKLLEDIADHKDIIDYIDPKKVKKIVYVNNNLLINDFINQNVNRLLYDIVAVNLMDFWERKFENLM